MASSVPTTGSCNGSSNTYIRSQFTSNNLNPPPNSSGGAAVIAGNSIDDLPPPGYAPSDGPPSTIGDLGSIRKSS